MEWISQVIDNLLASGGMKEKEGNREKQLATAIFPLLCFTLPWSDWGSWEIVSLSAAGTEDLGVQMERIHFGKAALPD